MTPIDILTQLTTTTLFAIAIAMNLSVWINDHSLYSQIILASAIPAIFFPVFIGLVFVIAR